MPACGLQWEGEVTLGRLHLERRVGAAQVDRQVSQVGVSGDGGDRSLDQGGPARLWWS